MSFSPTNPSQSITSGQSPDIQRPHFFSSKPLYQPSDHILQDSYPTQKKKNPLTKPVTSNTFIFSINSRVWGWIHCAVEFRFSRVLICSTLYSFSLNLRLRSTRNSLSQVAFSTFFFFFFCLFLCFVVFVRRFCFVVCSSSGNEYYVFVLSASVSFLIEVWLKCFQICALLCVLEFLVYWFS